MAESPNEAESFEFSHCLQCGKEIDRWTDYGGQRLYCPGRKCQARAYRTRRKLSLERDAAETRQQVAHWIANPMPRPARPIEVDTLDVPPGVDPGMPQPGLPVDNGPMAALVLACFALARVGDLERRLARLEALLDQSEEQAA
jgi:hypothetical protein